jgi:hypothetical protein
MLPQGKALARPLHKGHGNNFDAGRLPERDGGGMADTPELQTFYDLSVTLTGFSRFELDGTGMGSTYFETVQRTVGERFLVDLLRAYREVEREGGDIERNLRIRILGDPGFGPVAQNVILLWYTGNWNELSQGWRDRYGVSTADVSGVVSAASYQQGLMWTAAGAHPQGANQPGFGTWAEPPR